MKEWISGRNPVYETLRANRRHTFRLRIAKGINERGRIQDILNLADKRSLPVERVPRQQLDSLGKNHQGICMESSGYPYCAIQDIQARAEEREEPLFVLLLDTLKDPQNLGTLVRSAEATGVHGILLPHRRTASITPAVVHASSGASEHMLVASINLAQAISSLKAAGAWVIGLEGGDEASPVDQVNLDGPLALVVGSEAEGMRPLIRRSCDVLLSLPMVGQVESLNAAVAGSVVLYFAMQARRIQKS
jgi:23S rRNA (guanosine2251-2'-O)-methyltransferase